MTIHIFRFTHFRKNFNYVQTASLIESVNWFEAHFNVTLYPNQNVKHHVQRYGLIHREGFPGARIIVVIQLHKSLTLR